MHGRVYSSENGVDSTFEEMVTAAVARAASQGFPRHREGIWIVERGGCLLGSMAFTDEGDDVAMVRWVLLDPALRGKVLAIGGLKEKLLAAHRAGLFEVILPKDNEKDLAEVPENLRSAMKLHFVDTMDQVLTVALEQPLPDMGIPGEASQTIPLSPPTEGPSAHQ